MSIIDNRTERLSLPLPNVTNNMTDDCARIAEALSMIDNSFFDKDIIRAKVYRVLLKKQCAEAGFNLVDGSFEEGGSLTGLTDVLWCQTDGKYYQWHLDEAKTVSAGSSPTNIGTDWIDRTEDKLRAEIRETTFQLLRRAASESGFNLVDGSFEDGAVTVNSNDVVWYQYDGKCYGGVIGNVIAGSVPSVGWVNRISETLRSHLSSQSGSSLITHGNRSLKTALPPNSYTKKIIVFGSSVALGVGATNLQGWAYKLSQAISAYGYTYQNLSIGGNTTKNLIDRFYTDVVPNKPDVLMIAVSLGNEGLSTASPLSSKLAIRDLYIKNMKTLIQMARQQGYKVVVTGCYSRTDYSADDYIIVKQTNKYLADLDVPYIDFLGAVDDGTGKWRAAVRSDDAHPNDNGHEAMYRAIPLSMFDALAGNSIDHRVKEPKTNILQFGSTLGQLPLSYTPENSLASWTVCAQIRQTASGSVHIGVPLIAFPIGAASGVWMRVRNPRGVIELFHEDGLKITSAVNMLDFKPHLIAVTFDYIDNTYRLYIDGVLIGSASIASSQLVWVTWMGRANDQVFDVNGYEISKIGVWRTSLNSDQIKDLCNGNVPKASLSVWSPVVDPTTYNGHMLQNLAKTSEKITVGTSAITVIPDNQSGDTYITPKLGRGFVYPNDTANIGGLSAQLAAPITLTDKNTAVNYLTASVNFRKAVAAGTGVCLMNLANGSTSLYRFRYFTDNTVQAIRRNVDGTDTQIGVSFSNPNVTWHNLAIVIQQSPDIYLDICFYCDGTLLGKDTVENITLDRVNIGSHVIGAGVNAVGYEFRDFAIYNQSLQPSSLVDSFNNNRFLSAPLVSLVVGNEASYAKNSVVENLVSSSPYTVKWMGSAMSSIT